MIEGKIAGLHAANNIGFKTSDSEKLHTLFENEISRLRAGPFGEKSRIAKKRMIEHVEETV